MQETWIIVGVVLLAVLVGATVPVLIQLRSTLRTARELLDRVGPKLDGTLTQVREVSQRLNRVGGGLEKSTKRAQLLLDAAGDMGEAIQGLRESMKTAAAVGSALGPAIAAAVKALTELLASEGEPPAEEPAPLPPEAEPEGDTA